VLEDVVIGLRFLWAIGLLGCGPGPDPILEDTEPDGACGEVTVWDLEVLGAVEDIEGNGVEGVDVSLKDYGWEPVTTLGTAMTDLRGDFTMTVDGVTSVDGCGAIMLDNRIEGVKDATYGEKDINSFLFTAIDSGSLQANFQAFPLVIE